MTSKTKVYIAGVGLSPLPSKNSAFTSLISASTKALLDAGIGYDDVSRGVTGVRGGHGTEAFKAFDEDSIAIDEVKAGSELGSSFRLISDQGTKCVLMTTLEKSTAVALIVVSDHFLRSRSYLIDSSALVEELGSSSSASDGRPKKGLDHLCQSVWTLRGWLETKDYTGDKGNSTFNESSEKSFRLSRADGQSIPKWKDVEHKQDGKHRLRYNPAKDTNEISQEDFEAVKAIGKNPRREGTTTEFKQRGGDRAALARL